jgi:hypothetical protein
VSPAGAGSFLTIPPFLHARFAMQLLYGAPPERADSGHLGLSPSHVTALLSPAWPPLVAWASVTEPDAPLFRVLCQAVRTPLGRPTVPQLQEQISADLAARLTEAPSLAAQADAASSLTEAKAACRRLLGHLGDDGVYAALGLRVTVGTTFALPPLYSVCLAAFEEACSPGARMTAGARALAKHCHRDQTVGFWGVSTGPDQAKNVFSPSTSFSLFDGQKNNNKSLPIFLLLSLFISLSSLPPPTHTKDHARAVLGRLVDGIAWMNVHAFAGAITLEVRNADGYGARWTLDGAFRGFLEPQAANGHDVGWRH